MNSNTYRQRLKKIVGIIRAYGYRMFDGLTSEELLWRPEETQAQTIQSYLRHIVNAEIYWLKTLDDNTFVYLGKDASFEEIMMKYKQLENHLVHSIIHASKDDLLLRKPVFKEKELQEKGTLAWMVERTSLHAIHHLGQVAHIRYSLEKPPPTEPIPWGEVMDSLIFL
ncbi:MAG: DinB family protein [Promethearchaeota archaeon]